MVFVKGQHPGTSKPGSGPCHLTEHPGNRNQSIFLAMAVYLQKGEQCCKIAENGKKDRM